ncbi:MAG TPA: PilX N-terminal domain-containing pilus assembly protein [Xanthomonadales bacterium]|nr:PilX N-terminal domain-containing pilus assembly protein [Xanthomonadales bacterium]
MRTRIHSRFQRHLRAPAARQRGAALVVGLMFLILLTLLATVAMRQSITQERMAGGLRNSTLARNGAETAVRLAERQIYTFFLRSNGTSFTCDEQVLQGLYCPSDSRANAFRDYRGYTATNAQLYPSARHDFTDTSATPTASLSAQPAFILTDLGPMRPAGSGLQTEGGQSGTANYEGSGATTGGNANVNLYRITARSTGGTPTITRAVETTYSSRAKG